MKKKLSGIILATEIAAIVLLHAFKLNHQSKNDRLPRTDVVSRQLNISSNQSYAFSDLR